MLETNTLHYRCVQAEGRRRRRPRLQAPGPRRGDGRARRARRRASTRARRWGAFVEVVEEDERGDESFKERIQFRPTRTSRAIGWGVARVQPRRDGLLDGMWHVPGHTLRAHKDGRRFAQKRGGKTVWFKRFGLDGDVDKTRRLVADDRLGDFPATS
jgi:hypothetical protein